MTNEKVIDVTQVALDKIMAFINLEGQGVVLRLSVQSGGCSGFKYSLEFDDQTHETDHVFEYPNGVIVVMDKKSIPYLRGATLDFVTTLLKSGFVFNNPNAQSSCACGDSFQ